MAISPSPSSETSLQYTYVVGCNFINIFDILIKGVNSFGSRSTTELNAHCAYEGSFFNKMHFAI